MSKQKTAAPQKTGNFLITSTSFGYNDPIPGTYSFLGGNRSPQLAWSEVPDGTVSFALIMEDPDAHNFTHWVAYNIPASMTSITEAVPKKNLSSSAFMQGTNSINAIGYDGPNPPSGTHHYYFRFYALDTKLDLPAGATREQVMKAMKGHILAAADYMGRYWK